MDPVYRLPPFECQAVSTPFTEIIDWSQKYHNIGDLHQKNKGSVNGQPIRFAILDTGCDTGHEDLRSAIVDAKDFTNSRVGTLDRVDHGTWVAGCIAARANDTGVRGLCPESELVVAKVLGDNGSGSDQSIGRGLQYAFDMGSDFVVMSLGGPRMSQWLRDLFRELTQKVSTADDDRDPLIPFAASGNDGGPVNYPAAWDTTIAVGAHDDQGRLTRFTSRGDQLDIVAPGVKMISTIPRPSGSYGEMTGTSMACPFAAGVAGLVYGIHNSNGSGEAVHNVSDMRRLLKSTAKQSGEYGIINPSAAAAREGGEVNEGWDIGPIRISPAKPMRGFLWSFVVSFRGVG